MTSDLQAALSEPGMELWESGVHDKSEEDESEEPERSIVSCFDSGFLCCRTRRQVGRLLPSAISTEGGCLSARHSSHMVIEA